MQKKESMKAGDLSDNCALDVLIQTGLANPIAIALAESLLREAGVSFFVMDQNVAARQESGNDLGWWSVRAPRNREDEAREIPQSVEKMK
jgi:Putative prokaryotic signal transducing protein